MIVGCTSTLNLFPLIHESGVNFSKCGGADVRNRFQEPREMNPRELEEKFWGFKLAVRLACLTAPVQ